jgi:hypothetical protein
MAGLTVPDYSAKSDDELLSLALEANLLTDEARGALSAELRRRNLDSPEQLANFSQEQIHYKHLEDIDIGNLGLSGHGMGRRLYGRSNVEIHGTAEEYNSTVFAVVFFFPLVPMGAYRLLREQGSKEFRVLAKKPVDWIEVGIVWLKALAIVAVIPWAFHLFLRLSTR